MARFAGYGIDSYKKKHEGEQIEEIKTSNLKGYTAPDPKTLKNKKSNRRGNNSAPEDENI